MTIAIIQLVTGSLVIGLFMYVSDRLTKGSDQKNKRKEKKLTRKALAFRSVLAAGLVLGSNDLVRFVDRHLNAPKMEIHTSNSNDCVLLTIKVTSGTVDQIAIDYPILGVINKLEDSNSVGDARTLVARALGDSTEHSVLNRLQLIINNIRPGASLTYRAFYTPTSEPIWVAGADEYMVTYLWEYASQKSFETEWRFTKDDKPGKEPVNVSEAEVFHRELSPEEIRERFREGTHERPLQ